MKKVFIGSSSQALDVAYIVKKILEDYGASVTFWDSSKAFTAGDHLIDNLVQAAHQHDAGVFILNTDDQLIGSNNVSAQYIPRDNVLVEAGMFIGVLGKKSVALCTVPGIRETSDLRGIIKIRYDERNFTRLEDELAKWLNENVNEKHGVAGDNNVLMLPRNKIHKRYSINNRLHISDKLYKQIRRIRIMNFASNLVINPKIGEIGHIPSKDICLAEAIEKIMEETRATVEFILTEPNESNINDLETKVANRRAGSSKGALYSALAALYEKLTTDTIYAKHRITIPVLFDFYVIKTSMPFGIFNVEFLGEASRYNHVKVDLYSAALDNEDDRRSFVIWQDNNPENYQFFVDNFNRIKNNPILCKRGTIEMLEEWATEWENLKPGGIY